MLLTMKLIFASVESLNDVINDEIDIYFNDEHPLKARFWIALTVGGIDILFIEEHPLKMLYPIEVTDEGIIIGFLMNIH